jgi:hypothetical protein
VQRRLEAHVEPYGDFADISTIWKRKRGMMRLIISAVAVAALTAVGTFMLPSRSPSIAFSAAAMPPLQELHVMAGVSKLPVQDIEDQSLVYPTAGKR